MLSDIIGQRYAVQVLRNDLRDGHVTSSFLFYGPPHIGKYLAALQFAKEMLCENPPPGPDCCDACLSCRMIDSGKHPDVRSAHPAGPSRILRIAQIWPRDGVKDFPPEGALLHDLQFAPMRGRRRVFILADADALNEDAANSIVKVLEEPPDYATFILTAPSPSAVLPTIFSRCHSVRFQSVPAGEIARALNQRELCDDATARFLAAYSQGRIGEAIDLASDHDLRAARESVLHVADQLSSSRTAIHALKLADDLRKAGAKLGAAQRDGSDGAAEQSARQSAVAVLEILAYWYRDLLALSSGASDEAAVLNVDHAERLSAIAAHYSPDLLNQAVELILAIRSCVERNANAQIAFESMALRLIAMRGSTAAAAA